jgi:ribokinase
VLVTRGAQGVDLHVAGAAAEHVPAVPVTVRDTTGAGDAFTAAVAWALAAGRPLADAVRLAAAAGALATTSDGARGPLDPAEVTRLAGLG